MCQGYPYNTYSAEVGEDRLQLMIVIYTLASSKNKYNDPEELANSVVKNVGRNKATVT